MMPDFSGRYRGPFFSLVAQFLYKGETAIPGELLPPESEWWGKQATSALMVVLKGGIFFINRQFVSFCKLLTFPHAK